MWTSTPFDCIPCAERQARERKDHGDYLGPKRLAQMRRKPDQERNLHRQIKDGNERSFLCAVDFSVEAASG